MTPLAARLAGIVRAPRTTVAELAAAPAAPWVDVLVVSTLLSFASLAGLLATTVGQTALVDQWERVGTAFGRPVDDALYSRLQELAGQGIAYGAAVAVLTGPVLTLGVAVTVLAVLRASGQKQVTFRPLAAVTAHAGVILALRQLVAAPINYLSETLASPTSLALVLTGMDETAPLSRFLGVIDVFVLWWAIVLAMGAAAVTHRRARPLALTFTGVYVALALLLALAMAATGGIA